MGSGIREVNMDRPKIGLLPLYIELYDKIAGQIRPGMEKFYREIAGALEKKGSKVFTAPVCRVKKEFKSAIADFERKEVDALVTLHLAYSPSLESADALAATDLPVIVLDTTPTYDFGPGQDPDEIMYNHGIHGVQDMCNLLIRNGKQFKIEAGHWQKSDVISRVTGLVRSAKTARAMRKARVGRIGRPFAGMGDFAVSPKELKNTIGVETVACNTAEIRKYLAQISEKEIRSEMADDRKRFKIGKFTEESHRRTARVSLAVRRWIERNGLTAFTVNFLEINRASGIAVVPFLEASKAMARGSGYAGEGDVLTASLVGALADVYRDVSFVEMFCPDWKGNTIFLSHMGEVNPDLIEGGKARLIEMDYKFSEAQNPIKAVGCLRGGRAVFVNLAPCGGGKYRLIIAPVTMIGENGKSGFADSVRGWFRPEMCVADFLEAYSIAGGTHHAALVYGNFADEIAGFGGFMGWEVAVIE